MYCPNCGAEAGGKFCAHCGKPLTAVGATQNDDWTSDPSYRSLVSRPVIRDLIKEAGRGAKSAMSEEEFINKFLFHGAPIAEPVLEFALPFLERLGLKTGKSGSREFDLPIGRTIVATLCALASRDHRLRGATQADTGCVIEATLPSDFWSPQGRLKISIVPTGTGSTVAVETHIPGQLFDAGKSRRAISGLFDDIMLFAASQP
jgi:hypothetical protein